VTARTKTLAFGIAVAALAACSGASGGKAHPVLSHSPLPDLAAPGTVVGRFLAAGGPLGAQPSPLRGRVRLMSNHKFQSGALSSPEGWFSISAPAGSYTLTGKSSQFTDNGRPAPCPAAHRVTLRPGETSHVNIYCERR
jgi:hypothetical protein